MRQPPTGDKNKYEDQQRSYEGHAVVPAVGWLLAGREGVMALVDLCMPYRFTLASYGEAGSLCRVFRSLVMIY
jgi:hypothetical protein